MRDAVLGHHADEHDHAYLAVDAELLPREPEAEQAAEDAERHRHHHHRRGQQALELGHQHQIDHQQGQGRTPVPSPLGCRDMVLGLAGIIHRHAGGRVIRGPAIQESRHPPGCGRGHVLVRVTAFWRW